MGAPHARSQQQVTTASAAHLGGAESVAAQIMTNPTNETIMSILRQGPKLMLESMRSASDRNDAYLMVLAAVARAFSPRGAVDPRRAE
mgnify:CR=1 FL=1